MVWPGVRKLEGGADCDALEECQTRVQAIALITGLLRDHDLVCTESARDALAMLERERFDVIFSDLMMPIMTGMEFYERLLARDSELARRVVFVTGGALATSRAEDFLRSVPNVTLAKPFGKPEIQAVVARMLDAR